MGCTNSKKNKPHIFNEVINMYNEEYNLSSPTSISMSELSYMEPIKTKEQKRVEKIQITFREEYIKLNYLRKIKKFL
jgi:hypothetical protein